MSEKQSSASKHVDGDEKAILDLADELIESAYLLDEAGDDPAPAGNRVGARVDEVLVTLRGHHASEEEPGALFDSLREALPHRLRRVDELHGEHGEIVGRLEKLRDRLESVEGARSGAELAREARYIAAWIRRHESSEIELLYEMALGDDLRGGGD